MGSSCRLQRGRDLPGVSHLSRHCFSIQDNGSDRCQQLAVARARSRNPGRVPARSRPSAGSAISPALLGLSRSTSHRYVATLARLGYLEQNPQTRKYRLGPRVLDLGFSAINSMELRQISAPHLQQLSDETGRTVNMAILDGADIVYIERCRTSGPGQRESTSALHVGSRLPRTAHRSARCCWPPTAGRAGRVDRPHAARRPRSEHDHDEGRARRGAQARPPARSRD